MLDARRTLVLALLLALGACGGEEPAQEAAPSDVPVAGPPLEIPELTEAELMGIDRSLIVLDLPWSEQTVSRTPAPASARGTLRSVDIAEGGTFDRMTFAFGTDAPLPGYRVIWNDSATAGCGEETAGPPSEPTLFVAFEPAGARGDDGSATVNGRDRRPGLPTVDRAAQVCDRDGRVTWSATATDSARFRVIEMRAPPRVLVDVLHPTPR